MKDVQTIQAIYTAFGQGDVDTILSHVADNTYWDFNGGVDGVPWHEPVQGKANLPEFFARMAENMDFKVFEPREFIHCNGSVIVDVHLEYVVRSTGARVSEDQLQWWSLNGDGKVSRLRHYEDTAQVRDAVLGGS